MIAIVEHTEGTIASYKRTWKQVQEKMTALGLVNKFGNIDRKKAFKEGTFKRRPSYSKYTYSGELIDELSDLSALQVAMIVDNGFSWFGGSCSKNGLKVSGVVYTD